MNKITLRLDTSQLVQAVKCPTFHELTSVKCLMKKHADRTAMDRGTVMHGLLQRFYHKLWEKEQWPTAMSFAIGQLHQLEKEVKLEKDDFKRILMRFNDYVVKYANEHANINVATIKNPTGDKPAIEIGFSHVLLDNDSYLFVLEGRIDMIVTMSGCDVIWDHKAQGRQYFLYGHSFQMLNYALAANTNMTLYNYVRLHEKIQPNTFQRALKTIPRYLKARWANKIIDMFIMIANQRAIRNSENNIESYPNVDFPNQACTDIGFGKVCPFTSICEEESTGIREQLIQLNYTERKKWEPWSLDEITGENGE